MEVPMTDQEQVRALSSRARFSAVILMVAAIVLMVLSMLGVLRLAKTRSDLQVKADSLRRDVANLEVVHDSLEAQNQSLRQTRDAALEVVSGPSTDSTFMNAVGIRASYRTLPGVYGKDSAQQYRFRLWVSAPANVADSILRIEYNYVGARRTKLLGSSSDREGGFRLEYDDSAAWRVITLKVYKRDGTSLRRAFPMADEMVPEELWPAASSGSIPASAP
jgi:hypothetical protein